MKNNRKRIWENIEKITDNWFKLITWVALFGVLFGVAKNLVLFVEKEAQYAYIEYEFIILTVISGILLLVYIFKLCYKTTYEFYKPKKIKSYYLLLYLKQL